MQLKNLLPFAFGLASATSAPQSICDKYTVALLKEITPANQYMLLRLIVNTVAIGNYSTINVGITVPGILAPGVYNGENINLAPYFNGCLKSTNVNDVPSSVNFLDGGGATPLMNNVDPPTNSNQYYLVTHLYQYFGKLLGCSTYGQMGFPAYGGDPSQYRVHKYMSLNKNQMGYFISQVGLAAASFGVTKDDVATVAAALDSLFNYKCIAPAEIVAGGPQLNSMCIDQTCPLSPMPQCGLYPNGGVGPRPAAVASKECGYVAPAPNPQPTYYPPAPSPSPTGWSGWGNWNKWN